MRKQKSFPFWFVLFSLLFYFSCRKSDSGIPAAEKPVSTNRFFNLPESADPRLKSIAQSIMAQEKEHPFLNDFTKRAGWPIWDKVKIVSPRNMPNSRETGADSGALVYIPFVKDNTSTVNAVLAVNMEAADTSWRILYASNYKAFGFDTTVTNKWNAKNVFQFFALFDYDIFGHTKFLLKDERLFNSTKDSSIITLKTRNGSAVNGRMESYAIEECGTWEVCELPPAYARASSINNDCYYIDICTTYYYDDGGGGSGGGGTGDGGGGWTGDGSGGWGSSDPCTTQPTPRLSNVYPDPCSPGWVPTDGPYVLTEDDIRIWNQIEQEDAAADNSAPLDCQGTGTIGNLNWQGVLEHNIIQLDYLATHPTGRREFQIPNAGTPGSGRSGRADLADLAYNIMWEIKPKGLEADGQSEVEFYVINANLFCSSPLVAGGPPRVWSEGTGYAPHYFPSKYSDKYLKAYEDRPGVIIYDYVPKNTVPVPIPVTLPVNILDKLKELIDKLKEDASRFKEIISEYLREHPELVTFLKAAAWTAAVGIVVGTILEDFFSGGAGILDDIACFRLAYQIVRFAQAL